MEITFQVTSNYCVGLAIPANEMPKTMNGAGGNSVNCFDQTAKIPVQQVKRYQPPDSREAPGLLVLGPLSCVARGANRECLNRKVFESTFLIEEPTNQVE